MLARPSAKWKLGLALLSLVAVVCALLPHILTLRHLGQDPIEQVGNNTRLKLAAYERSGDPAEMREWLMDLDGGFGMEKMIVLAKWSCTHQEQFIRLVNALQVNQRKEFVEVFASQLGDSGTTDDFVLAFQGYDDPILRQILGRRRPPAHSH